MPKFVEVCIDNLCIWDFEEPVFYDTYFRMKRDRDTYVGYATVPLQLNFSLLLKKGQREMCLIGKLSVVISCHMVDK